MSPRRADPPTLEYVILGLIHLQPTHGYDLFQTFQQEDGIGMLWQVKPGRLYALLEKLENMGWLEPELKSGEGYLPRKEYRLSPAGASAFQTWLNSPVTSAHRMRQEFLARLYFAQHAESAVLESLLRRQIATCQSWLDNLNEELANLKPDQAFERRVFRFRVGQVQAMLHWLETCSND